MKQYPGENLRKITVSNIMTAIENYDYDVRDMNLLYEKLKKVDGVNVELDDLIFICMKISNFVYLEHDQGELMIERKEILYAEVQNKLLTVHCTSGSFELKRITLRDFCTQIVGDTFVQCHKSFAVNLEAVSEIIRNGRRNWLAIFVDGDACPISQTYYERVKREYMQIKPK